MFLRRIAPAGIALLFPSLAYAQGNPQFFMGVCWPGVACMTNVQVLGNVINALFVSASAVCVSIFILGAGFMVFSAGNDTPLQRGKGMMTGSLIGLAIIVGSYAIFRTVVFFLY
jgi:hypothetical protein